MSNTSVVKRVGGVSGVRADRGVGQGSRAALGEGVLDLRVVGEAPDLGGQGEVGTHAPAGEVPGALGVLGAVRTGVEVARPVVAGLLEQLDEEEGVLDAFRAEAQVLV